MRGNTENGDGYETGSWCSYTDEQVCGVSFSILAELMTDQPLE